MEPKYPEIPYALPRTDHVQGTAMDFGEFKVIRYRNENQTLFEFQGTAGGALTRQLERLVSQCRGDVGLDLSQVGGLNSSLIPVLERIRKRMTSFGRSLILCNPPSKLIDSLKLGGVLAVYPLVDSRSGSAPPRLEIAPPEIPEAPRLPLPAASMDRRRPVVSAPHDPPVHTPAVSYATETARKEMAHFDRSLKRTESLERGLDSAYRCVQRILPRKPPRLDGYRLAFTYRQSERVGGDFFDFIPLPTGELGLSVGDASGRGLEAAIHMCLTKKLISLRGVGTPAQRRVPPMEVLCQVNADLAAELDRISFVTALYAVLTPADGRLCFARAGHECPVVFSPHRREEPRFVRTEGAALGVLRGPAFRQRLEEGSLELLPGTRVLLYTDGVVDAQGLRGNTFSRSRLLESLRRIQPYQGPEDILSTVFGDILRHSGGVPSEDDMTALVIARD